LTYEELERRCRDAEAALSRKAKAEERLRHNKQVLLAIRNVNQLMVAEDDPRKLIEQTCSLLTGNLSYHNAWIALLDESGTHVTMTASSGFEGDFKIMKDRLEHGEFPECMRGTLTEDKTIVIRDPLSECTDCPLSKKYAGRAGMTRRLCFEGRIYGILSVSVPAAYANDDEEQGLFKEVAGDLAFTLSKNKDAVALRESEQFLQNVFDAIQDGISVLDPSLTIIKVNHWMEQKYPEYMPIIGRKCYQVYQKRQTPCPWCPSLRTLESGEVNSEIVPYPTADHPTGWIELSSFPVKDETGRVVNIIEYVKDITKRKLAEQSLREESLTLNQIQDRVTVTDLDGYITYINDAECRMLGRSREELIGKHISIFGEDPSAGATQQEILEETLQNGNWRGEVTNICADGSSVIMDCRTHIVKDDFGNPIALCGISTDITKRKRAEEEKARLQEQYLQSQKMEALGQLTGGVAHDFNNLLQVINGGTEMALMDLEPGHPARDTLIEIARAGQRAADLVSQLLLFSRRQIMQPEILDLNETVANMLKMLGRVIGEHIQLQWLPGSRVGTINADRGMIEQALLNLCVNSRDAMPGGGVLTIETREQTITEEYCTANSWSRPGRFAILSVTDTGCGMDGETLNHAFEPFFTTKDKGKGTGLGLATVYGIVKQHEGLIHASSDPGKGCVLNLYWPVCGSGEEEMESAPETLATGGTETILLAEDDEIVRRLAQIILERAGYEVLIAHNGTTALNLFEEQIDKIDMAILDVVMPEMSGREVYERIRTRRPDFKSLFTSGYSEDAIHTNFVLDKGLTFLQKPFSRKDLLSAVRKVLDRPPSS